MDAHEVERHHLMQGLLDAVKQCQVCFGGKTLLATEKDSSVQCLLSQFEQALQHGIRKSKVWGKISSIAEPLRQVTQKVLVGSGLPEMDNTFWSLLREHLAPLEMQHFQALEGITTDSGRARAWLRYALNESSLERQLTSFLADPQLLRQHYDSWALLLDEERASTLPIMARGLRSIFFAVETRNVELNAPLKSQLLPSGGGADQKTHRRVKSNPLPVLTNYDTEPVLTKKIAAAKKKRKRKVLQAAISDPEQFPEPDATVLGSSAPATGADSPLAAGVGSFSSVSASNAEISSLIAVRAPESQDHFSSDAATNNLAWESSGVDVAGGMDSVSDSYSKLISNFRVLFPNQTGVSDAVDTSGNAGKVSTLSVQETFFDPLSVSAANCLDVGGVADGAEYKGTTPSSSSHHSRRSSDVIEQALGKGDMLSVTDSVQDKFSNDRPLQVPPATPITPGEDQLPLLGSSSKAKNILDTSKLSEYIEAKLRDVDNCTGIDGGADDNADLSVPVPHLDRNDIASDAVSMTSSTSDSLAEDSEPFVMIGSSSSKFTPLMTYDLESSQAASDAIALLSHPSMDLFAVPGPSSSVQEKSNAISMEKYVPKASHSQSQWNSSSELSAADLKQAVLATAKRKEELEQREKVLKQILEEERDLAQNMQAENQRLREEHQDALVVQARKIQELTRENEVLKTQLKKYVAAVQLLRKDKVISDDAKETIGNLRVPTEDLSVPPKPKARTVSENDSIFEDKLAQMAEMHGELLEFNEMLQRQMVQRETRIRHMKEELVSLRGPLPHDIDSADVSSPDELARVSSSRPLINIWIPSVFLKGRGTDAHHLYQVYIRIADEEWNIYRRYSQFNKLHLHMSKNYPALENFSFPRKKMFGKKDLKFVEQRRRKLQEYLRVLINVSLEKDTDSAKSNKKELISAIPFFGDPYEDASSKKKKGHGKSEAKNQSHFYTGL